MKDFNTFLKDKFADKAFLQEYYHQATFFSLADQMILLRKQRGLTQSGLAEKAGTTQAVVSRLENVSVRPSLETIARLAEALDAVVEVRLVPIEEVKPFEFEAETPVEQQNLLPAEGIKELLFFQGNQTADDQANIWLNLSTFRNLSSKPSIAPVPQKKKMPEFA